MSHYMTALAMKQEGLKPATKIVLYWLADHHNSETGRCFPSLARLAKVCEMTKRSIQTHILDLERKGLIQVIPNYRDDGQQTSNNYTLFLEGAQDLLGGVEKSSTLGMKKMPANNLGNNNPVIKPIGRQSTTLSDNWVLSDKNLEDAYERGFTEGEIYHEANQFKNYHQSKGSKFKSWDAAWRTWLGNARKFAEASNTRNGA